MTYNAKLCKQILQKHVLKFLLKFGVTNAITILPRRDMSYPTFSFGCICGPKFQNLCLWRNWFSTNRDPFKYIQLLSTRSARGFQTFHSELSVVWAKRSLVANNIESKSYNSPLILKNVRFEYTKTSVSLRRFFWVPTKHCIWRNIPYIGNPMCHIFYSTHMRMLRCTRVRAVEVLLYCCNF